jgi:hypothetical protein
MRTLPANLSKSARKRVKELLIKKYFASNGIDMKKIILTLIIAQAAAVAAFAPPLPHLRKPIHHGMVKTTKTETLNTKTNESKHCIPLEELCLNDLPKVGGYVLRIAMSSLI